MALERRITCCWVWRWCRRMVACWVAPELWGRSSYVFDPPCFCAGLWRRVRGAGVDVGQLGSLGMVEVWK